MKSDRALALGAFMGASLLAAGAAAGYIVALRCHGQPRSSGVSMWPRPGVARHDQPGLGAQAAHAARRAPEQPGYAAAAEFEDLLARGRDAVRAGADDVAIDDLLSAHVARPPDPNARAAQSYIPGEGEGVPPWAVAPAG